jgi:hypothetical protein
LIYKGNWTEGKRSGTGSLFDKYDNLDYSGEWTDDKMDEPGKSSSYKEHLLNEVTETFGRTTFKG